MSSIWDNAIFDRLQAGQGTGPISKVMSLLSILALIYLGVLLFRDHQYLILTLLVGLGFTRVGHWVTIGIFVYSLVIQYWTVTGPLLAFMILGWLAAFFGYRNIQKNLYMEIKVDALEGMPDTVVAYYSICIFFGLAIITSGTISWTFWILFSLALVYIVIRYGTRTSRSWRTLHYPLLLRYASFAGYQQGLAELSGKELEMNELLLEFLKIILPDWDNDDLKFLVSKSEERLFQFVDKETYEEYLIKRYPSVDRKEISKIISVVRKALLNPEKALRVRYLLAELVELQFGREERDIYVCELLGGKVD